MRGVQIMHTPCTFEKRLVHPVVVLLPELGHLVLLGLLVVGIGAWDKQMTLILLLLFAIVGHLHPPAVALFSLVERNIEVAVVEAHHVVLVILLVAMREVGGTVVESLDEVPDGMGKEVCGLATTVV